MVLLVFTSDVTVFTAALVQEYFRDGTHIKDMMYVCQFVYEYGYTVLQALNHKRAKFKAKSRAKYACIIKFTNTRSYYIYHLS